MSRNFLFLIFAFPTGLALRLMPPGPRPWREIREERRMAGYFPRSDHLTRRFITDVCQIRVLIADHTRGIKQRNFIPDTSIARWKIVFDRSLAVYSVIRCYSTTHTYSVEALEGF